MRALSAVASVFVAALAVAAQTPAPRLPIIDVHLHAYGAQQWAGTPPGPAIGRPVPASAAEHMRLTLAEMDKYNIATAIVSGPVEAVEQWRRAAPNRILASPWFGRPGFDMFEQPLPTLDSLRRFYREGRLKAMAEITAQYEGLSPSDPALDPYFAVAEEFDVPVGIHTGTSGPGTPFSGYPRFRLAAGNPLLLEDLLVRRPRLRVFLMHGGEPWRRETVAMMRMYPQLYMDVAAIDWIEGPEGRPRFHEFLREMLAAGFGKRIMFGTDQMLWPQAIGEAIDSIASAGFLTEEQRRDIFYNNAAGFLRLDRSQSR